MSRYSSSWLKLMPESVLLLQVSLLSLLVVTMALNVNALPSAEDIQGRINRRYDELYMEDPNGKRVPFVCSICDEFLMSQRDVCVLLPKKLESMKKTFAWTSLNNSERVPPLEDVFKFEGNTNALNESTAWLEGLALSPRGRIYRKSKKGKAGFTCCYKCKYNIEKFNLPMNAIINKNYVGGAPKCLTDLTDVEQALLSPVKHHGYCFTWAGGKQKCMKGTLVFMRVKERRIAEAVTTLEAMGLTKHIIILLSGNMTPFQRRKAEDKSVIRTNKVIEAAEWLCSNHVQWKHIDFDEVREEIKKAKPVVIDQSTSVESENANVEDQELFSCYYPEGAATPEDGGFDQAGAFKKYVEDMHEKHMDLEFKVNLQKEFVKGGDSDQLISACLLQFPYGIGGMDEDRLKSDGSTTDSVDLEAFLAHLTRLSAPAFQTPLFQLVCYTLVSKERLLKTSRLQLKGETHAKNLAEGINSLDLAKAIKGKRQGNAYAGTNVSRSLLKAVDACSRSLPHTNDAAKKGRAVGECIQQYFGNGSVFLTVTPDDEHSLLMQVLTGKEVDNDEQLKDLSDEEIYRRSEERTALRLHFPGCTAIHFEMLLEILTEEVIGWDLKRNKPTEQAGFFGPVYAFTMAVEEQGRKSLHGHMTLWIENYRKLERTIFFGSDKEKKKAGGRLSSYYDHVATTTLMIGNLNHLRKAFHHENCTEKLLSKRPLPRVVPKQHLRDLRHKQGYSSLEGIFATCGATDCQKTWTYEELLFDYLTNGEVYCQPTAAANENSDFDYTEGDESKAVPRDRLRAEVIQFQKEGTHTSSTPTACINAVYQHHVSCHVKGCFKCTKKGRKHVCGPKCTCRYRLPDMTRRDSRLKFDYKEAAWYEWSGKEKTQPICQLLPKRSPYDLFQNVSCPAISESKMACNSNVSLILAGPIAQYQFKYQLKGTQADDTADYEKVHYSIKTMSGRVHESDRSEALRLICRASFAHNKVNVISAPMASYLVRNKERFYFSHPTTYCPLSDVIRLHDKKQVSGTLKFASDGTTFFENQALHYLCRPLTLEGLSLKAFTEKYYVLRVSGGKTTKNNAPIVAFIHDTGFFQHPSALFDKDGNTKGCTQGAKARKVEVLAKISQWAFPDTATFKRSIIDCPPDDMNNHMEKYAQLVLTLLVPHRSYEDLTEDRTGLHHPYTRRLQQIYKKEHANKRGREAQRSVFTTENIQFLQNIQSAAYNDLRYRIKTDELESCTLPFTCDDFATNENEEEEEEVFDLHYETLLEQLDVEEAPPPNDDNPEFLPAALRELSFKKHRNKGTDKSGFIHELQVPDLREETPGSGPFIKTVPNRGNNAQHQEQQEFKDGRKKKYSIKRVVTLFMKWSQQRIRTKVLDGTDIDVSDANGSVESIREWGMAVFHSDKKQLRAFEAITAAFVLTFYEDDAEQDILDSTANTDRVKYRKMKKALMKLRGTPEGHQMIALLHGPGGSGKSTVINMVQAYAKAFCESLGHEYTFRTIIVTAMSGVAATLLGGETAHSVLGLNKKRSNFTEDERDEFADCRLIIIDEISFASAKNFEKMQRHLSILLRKIYKIYGGSNVVFAGDYSQLEPVGQQCIYAGDACAEFHHRVNCFIELEGTWRFRDDPVWGERMLRFRDGNPTLDDIDTINDACSIEFKQPPKEIRVATHKNRDRDAINSSIFEDYCSKHAEEGEVLNGAVVIFMDELKMSTSKQTYVPLTSNAVKRFFYEQCGEDNCKMGESGRGRVDPMLKIYPGCPMMLTKNTDVPNGQANGSRVTVQGISVKAGEASFELELLCGAKVIGLFASQVKDIIVQHESEDIRPRVFRVEPESWTFTSEIRIGTEDLKAGMKGFQFPIISNSCTTGHKLQGCTLETLLVNSWHYGQNWTYVVLSRVKKMEGLYIRIPLTRDLTKYAMDTRMIQMLQKFKTNNALPMLTDAEYLAIVNDSF